jgi:hypothetical protein
MASVVGVVGQLSSMLPMNGLILFTWRMSELRGDMATQRKTSKQTVEIVTGSSITLGQA